MHLAKRIFLFMLAGCFILSLFGNNLGLADIQSNTLSDAVEGVFMPVPITLWENENGHEITVIDVCDVLAEVQFCDGDVLYYAAFLNNQEKLVYQTIDISTMEVVQKSFPDVFGEENIMGTTAGNSYCHVITDSAVYTFDAKLSLLKRTIWPAALLSQVDTWEKWMDLREKEDNASFWTGWDINSSGTEIAYRDPDHFDLVDFDAPLWENADPLDVMELGAQKDHHKSFIGVCALEPDAIPRKIVSTTPFVGYYFTREIYGTPHFITDDRVFIKNLGWEWSNGWEIWDLNGQRLYNSFTVDYDEYYAFFPPCEVKDAQGLFMHNPSSLMNDSTFYFSYETLQMERFPLFSYPPYNSEWSFSAIDGRTCIFAMPTKDASEKIERIDFFRCNLDTLAVEPLPLTLHGVELIYAGLAPEGRILFLYGDENTSQYGAGIFQCP